MPTYLDSNGAAQLVAEVRALVDKDYKIAKDSIDTDMQTLREDCEWKAGVIADTATGGTVSFGPPDRSNEKLLTAIANIGPFQNLHGYEYPWVGGTGKNLLKVNTTSQTINGITFTINTDGTVRANGTATADATLMILGKTSSNVDNIQFDTNTILSIGGTGSSSSFQGAVWKASGGKTFLSSIEITESDTIYGIGLRVKNGYTANNLIFYPMLRKASDSDETYIPYENICPISGRTAIQFASGTENLIKFLNSRTIYGVTFNYNAEDGSYHVYGTNFGVDAHSEKSTTASVAAKYNVMSPGVYIVAGGTPDVKITVIAWYEDEATYETLVEYTSNVTQFELAKEARIITRARVKAGVSVDEVIYPVIFKADNSNAVTIQLGTTVYGGTFNFNTGILTLTHALLVPDGVGDRNQGLSAYGKSSVSTADEYYFFSTKDSPVGIKTSTSTTDLVCSHARTGIWTTIAGCRIATGVIRLRLPLAMGIDTVEKFNVYLNEQYNNGTPVQIWYILADPIEIALTPSPVSVVMGTINTVWTDASSVSVECAIDIKSYIDKKFAELQALVLENGG